MGWLELGDLLKWPVIVGAVGTSIWLAVRWLRKSAVRLDDANETIDAMRDSNRKRGEIDHEFVDAMERARRRLAARRGRKP